MEAAMERLRRAGEVVIQDLPGHEKEPDEGRSRRELIKQRGKWQVKKI
jgi:ATP phosphoribosyltransferase regulatory subunit HisZ